MPFTTDVVIIELQNIVSAIQWVMNFKSWYPDHPKILKYPK